jgi:HPt (histidine-containing phosphotransfer) domain-containing protein
MSDTQPLAGIFDPSPLKHLAQAGVEQDAIQEIFDLFTETIEAGLAELEAAAANGKLPSASHRLQSACATVGAVKLKHALAGLTTQSFGVNAQSTAGELRAIFEATKAAFAADNMG